MIKTDYYYDFAEYYQKAQQMERKSFLQNYSEINDGLMQTVPIYNATIRKNAGFSNMLNDIMYGN